MPAVPPDTPRLAARHSGGTEYPRDMGLRPDARSAYPVRPGIAPRRQQETSMSLSTRKLGHQGLEVPTLVLGCMGMSQSYGPADDDESIAVLPPALELGCNFFDTAVVYGPFRNEARSEEHTSE